MMMITIKKGTPISEILKLSPPCECESCKNGCRYGSGLLAGDNLKEISEFLNLSEQEAKEKYLEETEHFNKKMLRPRLLRKDNKPYGKCVFFEGDRCKIHLVKPLQCKVSINCKDYGEDLSKWFMLNKIIDPNDPESIRQYSIYLKTNDAIPGGQLHEIVNDKEKLRKILDFEVLK